MVYDVIHVLLHHSHGRRMSHVFSHSNRKRNKCLLHLPGEARSFLWRTTQFIKSIEGASQAPSTRNPVLLKVQTFLYDSSLWIRAPKPPIFEATIQSGLFGSDAFDEFAWMTEIGYFWSHYVINLSPVFLNENFQVENEGNNVAGSHRQSYCMRWNQFCYFDDNNWPFQIHWDCGIS